MPITLDQNDLRVRKQLVKLLSAPRWSMRLPTRVDADRFISATREDRELRLMVLNDLRIRSAPRAPMMGYAAIAVALVSSPVAAAFAFSLNARVIDALGFRVLIDLLSYAQIAVAVILLIIGAFTLWVSGSGRYAVWLSAYEDAIEEQKAVTVSRGVGAAGVQRSRRRGLSQ